MDGKKLELIHVLFRHGEKTPDASTIYRKENANEYYPYGVGHLTNKGKRDMYDLGKDLRRNYNEFLGELYLPKHVDARSTEFERTKMSLQLVLAGLYPPKRELVWNDELLWQPIPTSYVPVQEDKILLGFASREYRKMYIENFKKSALAEKLMKDYEDVLLYIKEHTGLEMYDTTQVLKLRDCLIREKSFGILPDWVTESVMAKLKDLTFYEINVIMLETPDLKRLALGSFLEKLVYDSKQKIQGKPSKIHLYAAHEFNVAGILRVLDVTKPHIPEEGSCVVLELYSTSKGYEVQVKYKPNIVEPFETQAFSDGQTSWPFEKIEELLEKYGPTIPGNLSELRVSDRVHSTKS